MRHKLKLASSPTCLCGQEDQTTEHVVQRCLLHKIPREDVSGEDDIIHLPSGPDRVACKHQEEEEEECPNNFKLYNVRLISACEVQKSQSHLHLIQRDNWLDQGDCYWTFSVLIRQWLKTHILLHVCFCVRLWYWRRVGSCHDDLLWGMYTRDEYWWERLGQKPDKTCWFTRLNLCHMKFAHRLKLFSSKRKLGSVFRNIFPVLSKKSRNGIHLPLSMRG